MATPVAAVYRAGVLQFSHGLVIQDAAWHVDALLPPEHRVAGVRPVPELHYNELLIEGPRMPVVPPDEEPTRIDLVMMQQSDEAKQIMRWYGQFGFGLRGQGERAIWFDAPWVIMQCRYDHWDDWQRSTDYHSMLEALLGRRARATLASKEGAVDPQVLAAARFPPLE